MNVYDFDKTIYKKDCSVQFYLFVAKKRPDVFFKCFPQQIAGMIEYCLKGISKEKWKEKFFCFFKYIDSCQMAEKFVDRELKNINQWYLKLKKEDDVVITASPDFLVQAFMNRIGRIRVIGSKVDTRTGEFFGKNCYGEEKCKRFCEVFGESTRIENFYTDSYSDEPMAEKAERAFLVKKGRIMPFSCL